MVYIGIFIISIIFFSIALVFREKNNWIFVISSGVAILVPCVFAGLRDYTIGTDVLVYITPLFNVAGHFNSFGQYIANTGSQVKDILYLLLTFTSRKLSKDIFLLMFFSELLMIAPIYKTLLLLNKRKEGIIVGMLIYFFMLYNMGFNMVRQSISIAFSLLAFAYFVKGKYKYTVLNFIIAFLFHKSSIIMILAYLLYMFFEKFKDYKKQKMYVKTTLVILVIIGTIFLPSIIKILINIGILNQKHFTKILATFTKFDINYARTFFYIVIYIIIAYNKAFLEKKIKNAELYIYFSFISIFILQLGAVIKYSERIGLYYFFISIFFLIPSIFDNYLDYIRSIDIKRFIYKIRRTDLKMIKIREINIGNIKELRKIYISNVKKLRKIYINGIKKLRKINIMSIKELRKIDISNIKNIIENNRKSINAILVGGYMLSYWVYWIVIQNSHETFPYMIR